MRTFFIIEIDEGRIKSSIPVSEEEVISILFSANVPKTTKEEEGSGD